MFGAIAANKRRHAHAAIYDKRFGTAVDANGWFTFDLHSGSRRVWVNSSGGSDANDGLTAATAKATWNAAFTVFIGAGFTAGDQLMVAGTGGRTYSDTSGSQNLDSHGGLSRTYPTAVLSYDPANPSDATKYGKLTGVDMPVYVIPPSGTGAGVNSLSSGQDNGLANYIAIQGLEIKNGLGEAAMGLIHVGRKDGMCVQNCRFNWSNFAFSNASAANGRAQNNNVSKCSFWGAWTTTGSTSGLYADEQDGLWVQDCIFIHCGWKIGASRDDDPTRGGATVFGHGDYYHASNINGRFDRNVYGDSSADGLNLRGGTTATCNTSLREPIAGVIGGFSGSLSEAPTGVLIKVDDWAIGGGTDINSPNNPRGYGPSTTNTLQGSYLNNVVMFDNPKNGSINSYYLTPHSDMDPSQVDQYMTLRNVKGLNYSNSLESPYGSQAAKIHTTWQNAVIDVAATGTGNSLSSSGVFPNAKTVAQVITAMGFSSWAAMVNAMVYTPHFQWAQALNTIIFAAYGATLITTPTVSPPNMTGITPPVVYKTALIDLTLSTTSFTRGTSATATISGSGVNSTFATSGLPAGFSLTGTVISYDGSGTGAASSTFTITETSLDGLGSHITTVSYTISV